MKVRTSIIQSERSLKQVKLFLMIGLTLSVFCFPIKAQTGGAAYYRYDANGRLIAVLSPTGEAVTYSYDPAGNFTSITRYAANQLSILDFTPGSGGIGTQVTIYGTGFSATPSANTVKFNNVTATVTAATNIQLTVTVPTGATTGPINVSNANGAVNSSTNFFVAGNVEFSHHMVFGESKAFTFANPYPAQLTNVGLLTFDGIANQRVSLIVEDLISCLLNSNIPPFKYAQISIISPDGVSVTSAPLRNYWFNFPPPDYYPSSGIPGIPSASFAWIETLVLPVTGSYTVLIDPTDSSTCGISPQYSFGATARLSDVAPDTTGTLTTSGIPLPIEFSAPGQNAKPSFSSAAGLRVSLRALQSQSTEILSNLTVIKPDNTNLTTSTVGFDRFLEPMVLPMNGVYTVLLDPQFNKTRATTLYAYEMPPDVTGSVSVGGPSFTVQIVVPGQNADLSLSTSSTQTVTIYANENTIRDVLNTNNFSFVDITLLNSSGGVVASTTTQVAFWSFTVNNLAAGNYTIKVDPRGALTGSVKISVSSP